MKKITRSPIVYCKKINGKWYLLKDKTRYVYVLNQTAGHIWNLSKKPVEIQEIIHFISKSYQVDVLTIQQDVNWFIQELLKEGYLV